MKKRSTISKTVFAIATAALILSATSCEQLQSLLSSTQEEEQSAGIGRVSVASTTYYYNGTSTTDMSSETDSLALLLGQKATIDSTSGISVTYAMNYTNKSGSSASVTKTASGTSSNYSSVGNFSSDGKIFYLKMTPAFSVLDGSTTSDGTTSVSIKVSGFVNNDSDSTYYGRSMSVFSKTIFVTPLIATDSTSFSVLSTTTGKSFSYTFNNAVSLSSDAAVAIDDTSTSELENALTSTTIGAPLLSSDGLTVTFTPTCDLKGKTGTAKLTLSGIKVDEYTTYSHKYEIVLEAVDVSTSSIAADGSANCASDSGFSTDMTSLKVSNDSTNLYVTVNFAYAPKLWKDGHITILFDNASNSYGGAQTASAGWPCAATIGDTSCWPAAGVATKVSVATGSSIEGEICTGVSSGKIGSFFNTTASGSSLSPTDYTLKDASGIDITDSYSSLNTLSSATFKYTIPLSDLGLATGNTVYVYAAISNGGSTSAVSDNIPTAAGTTTAAWASSDSSVTIDMTKALAHTITE